jgi:hypothetical protein
VDFVFSLAPCTNTFWHIFVSSFMKHGLVDGGAYVVQSAVPRYLTLIYCMEALTHIPALHEYDLMCSLTLLNLVVQGS